MLTTQNLSYTYASGTALKFPDISLEEDEDLLILGASGVGKTTLLHLMGGLLKPDSGSITLANQGIQKLSQRKMDTFRGEHIGIVFQKAIFIQSLSVIDNIKAKLFFTETTLSTEDITSLLTTLNLVDKKDSLVQKLSEGQKQRLSIAIALSNKPKLILADEPTASLDDLNAKNVITLLLSEARKQKANLVVITHDHRIKEYFSKTIEL
ncbi:peptide ABC transporter ATP-binding protein [Neptunitalea chrysea]|uniref:Peptide ABC transporter ATP-binding protein n=1 Tax=Neptunitalea chrysea TaxID=1647581 RepID=A0A9W6B5W5_9FLAO|nr:ATP-binding cassette domain-containing protein [Neptunitalea chrysea]GLB51897.1 peptide ABC transporter ATP-binding protein [Neptunitalea chrysea]